MNIRKFFLSFGLLALFSTPVSAMEGQLTLYSEFNYFESTRSPTNCRLINVVLGDDLPNLVNNLANTPCSYQQSLITSTLEGPAGTMVTLFAKQTFGKEGGYIVVRKTDDKKVWLLDLMDFPDKQWKTIEASADSGGYEVYFKNGPAFDTNVASLKWGQWWKALP